MFYKGGNWTGWRAGSRVVVKNMAVIAFHEFLPSMRIECFMWETQLKTNFPDSFAVKYTHITKFYPMGCEWG